MQELQLKSPLTTVQYATVETSDGMVWNTNTSAFETPVDANWADYALILSPLGVGDNYSVADFPEDIDTAGVYMINMWSQLGDLPDSTDLLLVSGVYNWTGASVGPASNWVTVEALKVYLGITVNTYDTLLEQLIPQASLILSNALRRRITLTFYYEEYDGTGYTFIRTNAYPIVTLTNIQNLYSQQNPATYPGSSFVWNTEGSIRWKISQPNSFSAGFQNWRIAYQGGYNVVPQDLQFCCMMYCQFLYYYSKKDPTITSKTAKDVTIAYGRSLMGDFSSDSVFAPIEAILKRYKQITTL